MFQSMGVKASDMRRNMGITGESSKPERIDGVKEYVPLKPSHLIGLSADSQMKKVL